MTDDDAELGDFDPEDTDVETAAVTTDRIDPMADFGHPDAEQLPFKISDPVMDAAQGRPMVVIGTPDLTVSEWSEQHQYDLTDNYGNGKFGVHPDEPVVACRYVSDVSSDPSKTYTFPQSRLRLIDVHHADDGRRLYDRVAVDVLRRLFVAVDDPQLEASRPGWEPETTRSYLADLARVGVAPEDAVHEALELADVETRFGGEDE